MVHWPIPLEIASSSLASGIVRAGDSPNLRLRPHCSWVLTLAGEVLLRQDGRERMLGPGEAFLCRYPDPGHVHLVPEDGAQWRNLFVDWTGAEDEVDELRRRFPLGVSWPPVSRLLPRLTELLSQQGGLGEMSPDQGAELVRGLLTEFYRAGALPGKPANTTEKLARDALRAIRSGAASGMNVGDLARSLGVSPEHLSRVFRRHRGQTPSDFLRQERMQAACSLLESGELTCAEIAGRLGFSTPGNFTRSFHETYGITPGQFRANCRR